MRSADNCSMSCVTPEHSTGVLGPSAHLGRPFSPGLPPSTLLFNICFLNDSKAPWSTITNTLGCPSPHATWSRAQYFSEGQRQLSELLQKGLWSEAPQDASCFPSKSPPSPPAHRHWRLPKFQAPQQMKPDDPQTCPRGATPGSCRPRGAGAAETGPRCVRDYKSRRAPFGKLKRNIYRQE